MSGAWTAAALAVVAAGTQYYNTQQVAKKQDNQLAQTLRQQGMLQQKANANTQDLINKTAASNDTGAKANLLSQFMQQMQQQSGNTKAGLNQVGNVSSAYTKAANDASSGISAYGGNQAGLLSSIDAPAVQRQAEAAQQLQYGTDINAIKHQSSALDFLNQMKLRGIRANPWLTAVSQAAGGASGAFAGGAGGGGGSSVDPYSQGRTTSIGGGLTANLPNY